MVCKPSLLITSRLLRVMRHGMRQSTLRLGLEKLHCTSAKALKLLKGKCCVVTDVQDWKRFGGFVSAFFP